MADLTVLNWEDLCRRLLLSADEFCDETVDWILSPWSEEMTNAEIEEALFDCYYSKKVQLEHFHLRWVIAGNFRLLTVIFGNGDDIATIRIFVGLKSYEHFIDSLEFGLCLMIDSITEDDLYAAEYGMPENCIVVVEFTGPQWNTFSEDEYRELCAENEKEECEPEDDFISDEFCEPSGAISWRKPDGTYVDIRLYAGTNETCEDVARAIKSLLVWKENN